MGAVDADLAAAVDLLDARAGPQENEMAMRLSGRVLVRHGARQVFGQVQVQGAAAGDIELLHTDADSEDGQLPLDQPAKEGAIAVIAARSHRLHGGVPGQAAAAW